jgi:phage anti-repressor protein
VKDESVENGVKEFIEISTRTIGGEEVNSVSARDLYLDLGLDKTHWSRWSKENIVENEFLTQGVDFIQLAIMASAENPNPPKDYAVTIEFAKHIAMMAKTQRAHDYRNYFIECEKKAHEKTAQIESPKQSKPLLIIPPRHLSR